MSAGDRRAPEPGQMPGTREAELLVVSSLVAAGMREKKRKACRVPADLASCRCRRGPNKKEEIDMSTIKIEDIAQCRFPSTGISARCARFPRVSA